MRCWRPSSHSTVSRTSACCSRSSERSGSWSSPTASSTASLRPVAEAVVPLVCFVTAWFLRRQRAPHVAAGLEFLGGLLLPLVAYASFVDDGTLPPDLRRSAAGRGARARISGAVRRLRRMVGEAPGLAAPVPRCADGLAGRLGARARVRRRTGRGRRHPDAEPVADGRVRDRGGRLDRTRERVPDAPARGRDTDRRGRRPCPRVRADAGERLRSRLGGGTRRPDGSGGGRGDRPSRGPAAPNGRPVGLAWHNRSSSRSR